MRLEIISWKSFLVFSLIMLEDKTILAEVRTDVKWIVLSMKEIKKNYVTQNELNLRLKPMEKTFSLIKNTTLVALVIAVLGLIIKESFNP